ncbi:MAG: hypothetical protein GF384_04550, partial [Elusimicrobia bacterium]|nr:hypothetical protein [Elusimicrobiota bacterium]MBD3412114.1 hypothetical protein [Elusimicrobiota bacterium]
MRDCYHNSVMNILKKITLVVFFIIGYCSVLFAATLTWDGGGIDENWSTPANWDLNYVPGPLDEAVFDDTSNKPCTIDVSTTVASFFVDNTSTITITAAGDLTVTYDFEMSSGTFNAGSADITVGGAWNLFGSAVFNPQASTVILTGQMGGWQSVSTNGNSFYDLILTTTTGLAAFGLNDDLSVLNNLTLLNGEFNTSPSGSYNVTIGSSMYISNGTSFYAQNSLISIGANFAAPSQVFYSMGMSTFNFTGTGYLMADVTFYNLVIGVSGSTTTLQSDVMVENRLTIGGGTVSDGLSNFNLYLGSYNSEPLHIDTASTLDFQALYIYPDNDQKLSEIYGPIDLFIVADSYDDYTVVISTTNVNMLEIYGDYDPNRISTVKLSGTMTCGELRVGGGAINQRGLLITNNQDIYCSTNVYINYGEITDEQGSYGFTDIHVGGSWYGYSTSTASLARSTLIMESVSGSKILLTEGDSHFKTVEINAPGSTIILESPLSVSNLMLTAGMLDAKTGENNPIYVKEDWTQAASATFNSRLSTVTFHTPAISYIQGSTTFYNLVSIQATKSLRFIGGSTTTITGYLRMENVDLISQTQGATWYLNLSGTQYVNNVFVRDSNASAGFQINAYDSVDVGNNTWWNFFTNAKVWDGEGGDSNWTTPLNWSGNTVPLATESVVFNGTSNKECIVNVSTMVANFTMLTGSTVTVTLLNDFTVTENFTVYQGTFNAGNNLLNVNGNF